MKPIRVTKMGQKLSQRDNAKGMKGSPAVDGPHPMRHGPPLMFGASRYRTICNVTIMTRFLSIRADKSRLQRCVACRSLDLLQLELFPLPPPLWKRLIASLGGLNWNIIQFLHNLEAFEKGLTRLTGLKDLERLCGVGVSLCASQVIR